MPVEDRLAGRETADEVGPHLLLDRPRPPAGSRAARRGWRGGPGGGERATAGLRGTAAGSGRPVSARGGQRRTPRARGVNRVRPSPPPRQGLGAAGLLALEARAAASRRGSASSGRMPQAKCSNRSVASFQVARTAGGSRWTWPCDVAGDRPEVVRGRDPGPPSSPTDEHEPEPRQLVLGRARPGGRAEAVEHVLEAARPGRSPAPVPQRERPDRDPRPLAPAVPPGRSSRSGRPSPSELARRSRRGLRRSRRPIAVPAQLDGLGQPLEVLVIPAQDGPGRVGRQEGGDRVPQRGPTRPRGAGDQRAGRRPRPGAR